MLNVLVTGAAGYIGSNLLVALSRMDESLHVDGVDNFYTTERGSFDATLPHIDSQRCTFHEVDFYDLEKMVPLLERADVVVHLGEEKEKKIYAERTSITLEKVAKWRKNVEGFRRLLEASIICGVKRVVLSSWAGVYVASSGNKFSENEPLVPINQYYHQKISQEYYNKMFASEYLLDTVTLRISNVFGVGPEPGRWRVNSDPGVIAVMTESALRQGEIVVHNKGLQKRNFIYVGDVVDALVSMILSKRNFSGGTFNICADEEVKIIDIAKWIAEMCAASICYKDMNWQKNIVQHSVSNVKARKVLGFSPTGDVRDRLQEMVKKVRASGCFR